MGLLLPPRTDEPPVKSLYERFGMLGISPDKSS